MADLRDERLLFLRAQISKVFIVGLYEPEIHNKTVPVPGLGSAAVSIVSSQVLTLSVGEGLNSPEHFFIVYSYFSLGCRVLIVYFRRPI